MLKEIIIAIQAYQKAHHLIKKYKLLKYLIIPGILYALLLCIAMYFFAHTSNNFFEWLSQETGLSNWVKHQEVGMLGFVFTMSSFILWIVIIQIYFSLFKFIFLIIGSPIFAYLSERTAAILHNQKHQFSIVQLLFDMVRGARIAARNALWQTVYLLFIMLLCIVPLVGWCLPIIAFLIECYYYGFSMLDYSFNRNNKTTSESIFFIGHHKGLAMGNGVVFYLMHLIPIVGWVLAPAYSIMAATLSHFEFDENDMALN